MMNFYKLTEIEGSEKLLGNIVKVDLYSIRMITTILHSDGRRTMS